MSIRVSESVWRLSKHGGSELLCLLAIAEYADDSGVAYPSVATLAEKIRMCKRNTHYLLKSLEDSGELVIDRNKGRNGCNLYRVQTLQGAILAPVQPVAQGGATDCAEGVQRIAPEPSLNRQEPSDIAPAPTEAVPTPKPVATPPKRRKNPLTPLPDDFAISDRVKTWAASKGFDRLDLHFEHFIGQVRAKGYAYADWDEGFMTAVRMDWARLRLPGNAAANTPGWWTSPELKLAKANEVGVGKAAPGESDDVWTAKIKAAIRNGGKPPETPPRPAIEVREDGHRNFKPDGIGPLRSLIKRREHAA